MVDVLTIKPDEEVEQIQARLARARSRQVYLHLPKPNRALQRRLALLRLRRTAENLGLDLNIVTRDGTTRVMAGNVGLQTGWRLPRQQHRERAMEDGKIRTEIGEREAEHEEPSFASRSPSSVPHPPSSISSSSSTFRPPSPVSRPSVASLMLAATLLVLGSATGILFLPSATVTLIPTSVTLETTVKITADPSLTTRDVAGHRIPARRLEVTLDRQAREPTVAYTDIPEEPARGTITFINQSESQVKIPVGSIVSTSSGTPVEFRTQEMVVLSGPAGTTARVEVEAVEPGPSGNVPAYTIDVLDPGLGLPVAAVNEKPLSGGTAQQEGLVTQEQLDRMRNTLLHRTRREAVDALQAQVRESEQLVEGTVEIQVTGESFSVPAGTIADEVAAELSMRAVGTAIDLVQAQQLAEEVLRQKVPAEQEVTDDSLTSEINEISAGAGGTVSILVTSTTSAQTRISKSNVKNAVLGRPIDEVPAFLRERFSLDGDPVVDMSRGWLGRMPWLPMRIDVVILSK